MRRLSGIRRLRALIGALSLPILLAFLSFPAAAPAGTGAANSADRMIVWMGCDALSRMSDAELNAWRDHGAGGFVCMTRQLRGLGGENAFSGDENAPLRGAEYALQRRLRDSRLGARLRARGMKAYLGVYLTNYWNPRTPLGEWFDDATWSGTVLPNMGKLAAAATDLGFAGLAFDQELYRTQGGRETATWDWRYPGAGRSERAVRAQARRRGRELMATFVRAFRGVELLAYDVQLPGSWNEVVQFEVNGRRRALDRRVDVDFWDGLTSVDGYGAVRLADHTFYKVPHVGTWEPALAYNASSLYAELSRRLSNWDYAASRFHVSPFAWIEDGPAATVWDDARPPDHVARQLAAFRKWGTGGEFTLYAPRGLSAFDYRPYRDSMRAASRPGIVDRERPRLAVSPTSRKRLKRLKRLRLRRAGAAIRIGGEVGDNMAVRAVTWRTDSGRTGAARVYWKPVSGSAREGYRGQGRWVLSIRPQPGERRLYVRAEDIKGLAVRRSMPLRAPANRR